MESRYLILVGFLLLSVTSQRGRVVLGYFAILATGLLYNIIVKLIKLLEFERKLLMYEELVKLDKSI